MGDMVTFILCGGGFNRTFMELKLLQVSYLFITWYVLIVPLWN